MNKTTKLLIILLIGSLIFISGCTSSAVKCPTCNSTNTHKTTETDQRTLYKCDDCGSIFGVYKKTGNQTPGLITVLIENKKVTK